MITILSFILTFLGPATEIAPLQPLRKLIHDADAIVLGQVLEKRPIAEGSPVWRIRMKTRDVLKGPERRDFVVLVREDPFSGHANFRLDRPFLAFLKKTGDHYEVPAGPAGALDGDDPKARAYLHATRKFMQIETISDAQQQRKALLAWLVDSLGNTHLARSVFEDAAISRMDEGVVDRPESDWRQGLENWPAQLEGLQKDAAIKALLKIDFQDHFAVLFLRHLDVGADMRVDLKLLKELRREEVRKQAFSIDLVRLFASRFPDHAILSREFQAMLASKSPEERLELWPRHLDAISKHVGVERSRGR